MLSAVRDVYEEHLSVAEIVEVSREALALREAYLRAGIVGASTRRPKSSPMND